MIINAQAARIERTNRVARQWKDMLIIAQATNDDEMRNEMLGRARDLDRQLTRLGADTTNDDGGDIRCIVLSICAGKRDME